MKLYLMTLAFLGLTGVAFADDLPDPNTVSLGDPAYAGTGCPSGSAAAVLSPDRKSLSIMFDKFEADAGRAAGKSFDRKNCDVGVPVHVPSGFSVSVLKVDFRGFSAIPAGGNGQLNAEFFFAGQQGPTMTKQFAGGTSADFTTTSEIEATAVVWGQCGVDTTLRMNSSILATSNAAGDQTMMSIDSIDTQATVIYQLQWQRCDIAPQPTPVPTPVPTPIPTPVPTPAPTPRPLPPMPQPPHPPMPPMPQPQPPHPPMPPMPQPQPPAGVYVTQEFARIESDVIYWDTQANNSPYGSFNQQLAIQRRTDSISQASDLFRRPGELSSASAQTLEQFALDLDRKLNSSTYGTALYNFYQDSRSQVWPAYVQEEGRELDAQSWRAILPAANALDTKVNSSTYGTTQYNSYQQARNAAYDKLEAHFTNETNSSYVEFRQVEQVALQMNNSQNSSTYGTRSYTAYGNMATTAFARAVALANTQLPSYDFNTLRGIQADYQQKLNSSTYGTRQYNYYQQIKQKVESLLLGHRG